MKKTLVSGVQSSGTIHIGNYFGAIKQNIELANSGEYDSFIFIADYHSMTTLTDRKARFKSTFDTACVYLACGLDVSKAALFKQSDVPAHTELAWILNTVTPMSMLNLAHSYKDKVQNSEEDLNQENQNSKINAGLFTYPVLMAADILIYNAEVVPVGSDQKQHVEYAREIAGKYNRTYNKNNPDFSFKMPQAYIKEEVATVPGLDGTKMSKSKGNVLPLFASDEDLKKAVFNIVTDSARPEDKKIVLGDAENNIPQNNIYAIHALFLNQEEKEILKSKFENASIENPYGYKQAKDELLATVIKYISPMREKYNYYQNNPAEVLNILAEGKIKAKLVADANIKIIRQQVGLE